MNVHFDFTDIVTDITAWRRGLHERPELGFDTVETASFVAERLRGFGCDEVVTGIAQNGVVAIIRGRKTTSGNVVGLRADMDALPLQEETGKRHASRVPGCMHACGHDGHTAMLLGTARYLCETRAFDGTAVLLFQPAEETGGGATRMLDEGVVERFGLQEIYGLHNFPGLPIGAFAICEGPMMAATDEFRIIVRGRGGHAAQPNATVDTTLVASQIVVSLQSVVARNMDPADAVVISVAGIRSGAHSHNVIPAQVELLGTCRTFDRQTAALARRAIQRVVSGTAAAFGAQADLEFTEGCPSTVNHSEPTRRAIAAAQDVLGVGQVLTDIRPVMASEDFGAFLQQIPGAYIFLGNGFSAPLHHPEYDFDDKAIAYGVNYWMRLVESTMPLG